MSLWHTQSCERESKLVADLSRKHRANGRMASWIVVLQREPDHTAPVM